MDGCSMFIHDLFTICSGWHKTKNPGSAGVLRSVGGLSSGFASLFALILLELFKPLVENCHKYMVLFLLRFSLKLVHHIRIHQEVDKLVSDCEWQTVQFPL